ncbi:hypothetical protein E2C01_014952 [Portunus trituberculatus]|uniref:Uncharacterized protein n=1 Tax=Portunus trituberculatus TaxID=210409 RepID=A0A5B7DKI5_PORTR|nr:hypothetical protein [Portunus trituberculatus]
MRESGRATEEGELEYDWAGDSHGGSAVVAWKSPPETVVLECAAGTPTCTSGAQHLHRTRHAQTPSAPPSADMLAAARA